MSRSRRPADRVARTAWRRANQEALPAHLPPFEILVDAESLVCTCCSGALHRIDEDVAERWEVVPAQVRVLMVRPPD